MQRRQSNCLRISVLPTDDGWLHPGDKGVLDAARNLKITGRVKRNRVEDLFAKNYETWSRMGKVVVWHEKSR